MFVVRPVAPGDLPALLALSERTGHGLTTLPANRDRIAHRIDRSIASFAGRAVRADECYTFVLEDIDERRVAGVSSIEVAVGLVEPFYNYRVGTVVHASRELGVYTSVPTLFLTNDHTGHSELCTLFVDQRYRHRRNGPLIAKSRLLFVAEFRERFAAKVIAELRGPIDASGRSPFWEGLGRHFFALDYSTADYLTGLGRKAFIAELMPRHPVYVNLLSREAQTAVAAVHEHTAAARAMLEQEGFRYEGCIDIFDAGPTLEAFRDDIGAVRASKLLPATLAEDFPAPGIPTEGIVWLVSNRRFDQFRAILVVAPAHPDRLPLELHAARALGVEDGDTVRAVPLSPRDR